MRTFCNHTTKAIIEISKGRIQIIIKIWELPITKLTFDTVSIICLIDTISLGDF